MRIFKIMCCICLIILCACVFLRESVNKANVSSIDRFWKVESKNLTEDWKLGDDIWPLPEYGDCDDRTLYSYNYIKAFQDNYDVQIMAGYPIFSKGYHVWLIASNNEDTYIYDNGVALPNTLQSVFPGKQISYKKLLKYALQDEEGRF